MSDMLAAFAPNVTFTASDGNEYRLSPVTLKDMADYVLWFKFLPFEGVKEATKDLPDKERMQLLSENLEICAKTMYVFNDAAVYRTLDSPSGMMQILWQAIKKNHPEVTKEHFLSIVTPQNYKEIYTKLELASGLVPAKKKESQELKKKPTTRTRKSSGKNSSKT